MATQSPEAMRQKAYRERQKLLRGSAFNKEEAQKRKARRHLLKEQTANIPKPTPEPNDTISRIYEIKKENIKDDPKKHLTIDTVETQFNRVKRLKSLYKGDLPDGKYEFLRDTEAIYNFIMSYSEWNADTTRATYIFAISSILETFEGFENEQKIYSKLGADLRHSIDFKASNNKLTETEKKNYVEWERLKNLYKTVRNQKERALIGIYTITPPRRVEDYRMVKIVFKAEDLNPEFNYLIVDRANKKMTFLFYKYKTQYKKAGADVLRAPDELYKVLISYIRKYKLKKNDFLFPQLRQNKELAQSAFSEYISETFKKYTGKAINLNLLRHSIISDLYSRNPSNKEKFELSYKMGHSVATQSTYNRIL